MHSNTYNAVGVSVLKGVMKVRFANGLDKRKKLLESKQCGHVDVVFVACADMLQLDAVKFAKTQVDVFNAEQLACFDAYLLKHSK